VLVEFTLRFDSSRRGISVSDMSDWAKKLTDEKKQKEESRESRQQYDLSNRKMLDAHREDKWEEVCAAMEKAAATLRHHNPDCSTVYRSSPSDVIISLKQSLDKHIVKFYPGTWRIASEGDSYCLTVIAENKIVWKDESDIYTSATVAQAIVGKVFKGE